MQSSFLFILRHIHYVFISARPTTSSATVTVNSFDTSLSAGKVLANFTANTTNGNSVAFTMSTLTKGKRYFVNVSGNNIDNPVADNDGVIQFSYSDWPAGVFTVVEDISPAALGNLTVMTSYVNNTLLTWASVDLYQGGKLIQSGNSSANGIVQFKNIPAGSYSVNTTKGKVYGYNASTVNVIAKASINLNMALMYYDLNGDGRINVLDLEEIIEHFGSPGRPVYDVNGDGFVDNTKDIEAVKGHFDQKYDT